MNTTVEKKETIPAGAIQFERRYSMKNGNKVTKKNWHKVVAISSRPCTNVRGHTIIDAEIRKNGVYFEKWELRFEEAEDDRDSRSGYIFREVNHNGGINGRHTNFRSAIWGAIKDHISVYLTE